MIRDDGDQGMVLRFKELPGSIQRRLEELVAKLLSLPSGDRSGVQGPGNVGGEILGRDTRPDPPG